MPQTDGGQPLGAGPLPALALFLFAAAHQGFRSTPSAPRAPGRSVALAFGPRTCRHRSGEPRVMNLLGARRSRNEAARPIFFFGYLSVRLDAQGCAPAKIAVCRSRTRGLWRSITNRLRPRGRGTANDRQDNEIPGAPILRHLSRRPRKLIANFFFRGVVRRQIPGDRCRRASRPYLTERARACFHNGRSARLVPLRRPGL